MSNQETLSQHEILRLIPSIDTLLRSRTAGRILPQAGVRRLTDLARVVTASLRREIQEKNGDAQEEKGEEKSFWRASLLEEAEKRLENAWQSERSSRLQRVINATGVIIHTNLGRAPLSDAARKAVYQEASRYCNLEYDIETGRRGCRAARCEFLLAELTGAESALIVNNCAAAAFLVLTVLAQNGEVITSRGELVEIGGDFRVPDVMAQSGACLREVGTTNRTRVSDYEKAINENTRLILKVHPSNYRIIGFTSTPTVAQLADLAHQNGILLYEDAGSGALFDLSAYGFDEPVIGQSIAAGADVVTFSGDKLLGGAQAGLIVGRRESVEKIRKHPLYRALRADKLIYAVLEATLEAYLKETALREIPVLRMLSQTGEDLKRRAAQFAQNLRRKLGENHDLRFEIIDGNSVIGGGSAPGVQPPTTLIALEHKEIPANRVEENLRFSIPPVITRILENKVLIDLRTVSEDEEKELLEILTK